MDEEENQRSELDQNNETKMFYIKQEPKTLTLRCNVLKVVPATLLVVGFLRLNKTTSQTRKNVYFTSKLLSFWRKLNFRILDFQIS